MNEEKRPVTNDPGDNCFINLCVNYNLEWIDTILKSMNVDPDNKDKVSEVVVVYLHMIEADARRKYDLW